MKKYLSICLLGIMFSFVFVGVIEAMTVTWDWDMPNEPDIAGAKMYWDISYQPVWQKSNCMVMEDLGDVTTVTVIWGKEGSQVFFIGVTAYDDYGRESEPAIGYVLWGNIYGIFGDTPYTDARVDGEDASTLAVYFGEFFVEGDPELKERSDLDKNGQINGQDLIELGFRFGNDCFGSVF